MRWTLMFFTRCVYDQFSHLLCLFTLIEWKKNLVIEKDTFAFGYRPVLESKIQAFTENRIIKDKLN